MPLPPAPTALRTLALQYAALEPLHALSFPPALDLARAQLFLVAHTLDEPTLVQYPPAASYRRAFLKALVDRLEQGVRESDEEEELVRLSRGSRREEGVGGLFIVPAWRNYAPCLTHPSPHQHSFLPHL